MAIPTPGWIQSAQSWYDTNVYNPYIKPVVTPVASGIYGGLQTGANIITNIANTDPVMSFARTISPGANAAYNAGLASVEAQRQLTAQERLASAQQMQAAINAGYPASPEQRAEVIRDLGGYARTMGTAQNPESIRRITGEADITSDDYPKQNLEQEIPNVTPFTFDWVGEVDKAYNALENFYNKLLEFAGGRVDIAKRLLEYTYQQGMRETAQDFEEQAGELGREKATEVPRLQTTLNRRGVYNSGFGGEERRLQDEGFAARQLSLERAKQNKESRLTTNRDLGMQEQNLNIEEEKFNLERQRRKEAEGMAQNQRSIKGDIYNAELAKQSQEEQRRVQNITSRATGQIAGGSTTASSSGEPGSKWTGKDQFGREYGGWYWQPNLGKAQRWWGNGQWTDQ